MDKPNRRRIRKRLVRLPEVRAGVKGAAQRIERDAQKILAAHRHAGDATIESLPGSQRVDWFVVLNDEKGGNPGALAIEFGRHDGSTSGAMEPIAPLRLAAGLNAGKGRRRRH